MHLHDFPQPSTTKKEVIEFFGLCNFSSNLNFNPKTRFSETVKKKIIPRKEIDIDSL